MINLEIFVNVIGKSDFRLPNLFAFPSDSHKEKKGSFQLIVEDGSDV